jgi:hypothetical protein
VKVSSEPVTEPFKTVVVAEAPQGDQAWTKVGLNLDQVQVEDFTDAGRQRLQGGS